MNLSCLLAMLLIVTQAPVPVPRQVTNTSTTASSTIKSQRKSHDASAAPPVAVIDPATTPSSQPNSGKQVQDNDAHAVVISKFPTVSMSKDWADWGLWVFNFLLVVVGALQVTMLLKTLRAIRTQGEHMERQTGILEKSVIATNKSITSFIKDFSTARQWLFHAAFRKGSRYVLIPISYNGLPEMAKPMADLHSERRGNLSRLEDTHEEIHLSISCAPRLYGPRLDDPRRVARHLLEG